MTNEEALEYWEKIRKTFMEHYESEDSYWGRHHWMTSVQAVDATISALRDRIARQNPQPLTLEELCGMDGEPVWLKDGIGEGWFLASAVVGSKIYFCEKSITIGEPISECGKTWLAYRTKPEPPERS